MKIRFNKLLLLFWFMLFSMSFFHQFPKTNPGLGAVLLLTTLFWVIEKLIKNKLATIVLQITLSIVYLQGMSTASMANIGDVLSSDFSAIYFGQFSEVSALFNGGCSVLMAFLLQKVYLKQANRGALLIGTLAGSAILIGLNIYTSKPFLGLFIVLGLYLIAENNIEKRYLTVQSQKVSAMVLLIIFIFFAFSWSIDRPLQGIQTFEDIVNEIDMHGQGGSGKSSTGKGDTKRSGYSESDEVLGFAMEMDDTEVLKISTDTPHYLRGHYRYKYNGRGWSEPHSIESEVYFPTSLPVQKKEGVEYTTVEGEVEVLSGRYNVLFTPGNTEAIYMEKNPSITTSNYRELEISNRLTVGDSYGFVSHVPNFSVEFLEEQPFNRNPEPKALQLPDGYENGPVSKLTDEIIEGYEGPYNKAKAIESYLRRNYRYSLDVYPPKEDQDLVEEFLFTQEQGYCVHFSTAFVVMARLAGLEARWVSGFSNGTIEDEHYIVRGKNAHAWPEVYIANSGWVPFEPTPGFTHHGTATEDEDLSDIDIEEEETDEEVGADQQYELEQGEGDDGKEEDINFILYLGGGMLLFLGLYTFYFLDRRRKKDIGSDKAVIALYNSMLSKFKWIGLGRKNNETPLEYRARLKRYQWLPQQPVKKITYLFQSIYYGGSSVSEREVKGIKTDFKKVNYIKIVYNRIINFRKMGKGE
ncbi:transglutaminaseTgpA domain-containing protein [Proteinivorax tanatarense]|uniref:TransglutaminaseTgpA domain-containing protein n=1 Tax=Proteinivorax tanatarense TaxID=1260629 RepID=A0AAU7VKX7_9FIRM